LRRLLPRGRSAARVAGDHRRAEVEDLGRNGGGAGICAIAEAATERLGIEVERPAAVEPAGTEIAVRAKTSPEAPASSSFLGLSLREALERAHAEGLTVEVVGSGYVVKQDPPPGRPVPDGKAIRLQLDATGER